MDPMEINESIFRGIIGRTVKESHAWWPEFEKPPKGSPNVLFIVLDDVGFGHLGCYGSDIYTPNINSLAAEGLRYTNWKTTALCSPTRSCLLTGRNHHSNGMACITEATTGYPGYNGVIPKSNGFISEILKENGFNTFALGKWHLTPADEISMAGPFERWPLGRGFERYYGFLGGEANQWHPGLVYDNHFMSPPYSPEEGYHLSKDLSDKAIQFIKDAHVVDPEKPFFMYLAYGACHAPHHVPREYIDRYKGKFDKGWDKTREEVLSAQKILGLVPEDTCLPPRNPGVDPWEELSEDQRRLYARMQEVFAATLTYTDEQIGRVLAFMKEIDELDNTLVILVSDNGASAEGGAFGSVNENNFFNMLPDDLRENLKMVDEIGSPRTYNHYPIGWAMAGNTPFKMWKRYTYEGGVAAPCIFHWPAKISDKGGIRHQFHHAIDIVPTILELLKIEAPTVIKGIAQSPVEGVSMAYTLDHPREQTRKEIQYFEMLGTRAIWYKGWKAVTTHEPGASAFDFENDTWELYDLDKDPNEIHNLAAEYPDMLKQMIERWWMEAGKYKVLPLDDRQHGRLVDLKPRNTPERYIYYPDMAPVPENVAADIKNVSHRIVADLQISEQGAEGVILSQGSTFGGFSLYIKNKRLIYHYTSGKDTYHLVSDKEIPIGEVSVSFEFEKTGRYRGIGRLYFWLQKTGEIEMPQTIPIVYSLTGEGLCCGRDIGATVSQEYDSPFAFTGKIKQVTVAIEGVKRKEKKQRFAMSLARE